MYRTCHNCWWLGLCFGCQSTACKDHFTTEELDLLPSDWGNPVNHSTGATANKLRELNLYK